MGEYNVVQGLDLSEPSALVWHKAVNLIRERYMSDQHIDGDTRTEIEAAVYRKLIEHLRKYPEVQNIDLMNLAYFCRNCLSKWYRSAAAEHGIDIDYDQAREIVYGMPYPEYKDKYSREANPEQLAQFAQAQAKATE